MMDSAQTEARIRHWARARALPQAYVARWLGLTEPSRTRLLELAEALKFRTGQFITAFELSEEIAARENTNIADLLCRPRMRQLIEAPGSGPGKARALLGELRVLRYPRLKQATERFAAAVAALGLPRAIRVILPRELASDELRIELVAHGSGEMDQMLKALSDNADQLVRIAAMLGGTDNEV